MSAFRVFAEGALVDVVTRRMTEAVTGRRIVHTEARLVPVGTVLRPGELAPELERSWAAGDTHLRAVLERITIPGMPPE